MTPHRHALAAGVLLASSLWCLVAAAESVVIGAENDAAPWSYADGSGYVNDLVRAAYNAVGWEVKFDVLPYARCKLLTDTGLLAGCFSASKTPETEKAMQFPKSAVFAAVNGLYVPANSNLVGCSAAKWGLKIRMGLVRQYEYSAKVNALVAAGEVTVDRASSEAGALRMLNAGRFDAAIITTDPIKRIEYVAALAGIPPHFRLVCEYGLEPAYIGFSRKNSQSAAALAAFDRGMEILKMNGAIERLQTAWSQRALQSASPKK